MMDIRIRELEILKKEIEELKAKLNMDSQIVASHRLLINFKKR
ncbi:MAG: hypothetical protein ACRC4T_05805 [Cetobacterium sp.]